MSLITLFLAKFIDPISFVIAGLGGVLSKKPYAPILIGIVTAIIVAFILGKANIANITATGLFIGILASIAHAYIGFYLGKKVRKIL